MTIEKRNRYYGATRLYWFRCTDCGKVNEETSSADDRNTEAAAHVCPPAATPPVWHGCINHNCNHCPECRTCDCQNEQA